MRYPHYITKSSAGRWPDLVMCVDCKSERESVGGHPLRQRERLVSWYCQPLILRRNDYLNCTSVAGTKVEDWWAFVDSFAQHYQNILILSYQCGRVWALLGFWDKMEEGHVEIGRGADAARREFLSAVRDLRKNRVDPFSALSAGEMQRLLARDEGLLVCEDSTYIARFRLSGIGNNLLWIDVRNHGYLLDETEVSGGHTTNSIAMWYTAYARTLRRCNLGAIKATAGQQAFKGWRHGYYTGGVHCHTDKRATKLEELSYYGGRCECFKLGYIREIVYHIDVRSMYPSICVRDNLPVRLQGFKSYGSLADYERLSKDYGVIARVCITTDEPDYPILRQGNTIWPRGRFITSLAGPELSHAVQYNRITAWHEIAWYEMDHCLRDYANVVYGIRQSVETDCNEAVKASIKKLLVCLPGKFGQRLRVWQNAPDIPPAKWWGEWWGSGHDGQPIRYRSLGGTVQRHIDMGWGGEAVPAIAAWITSAGRMVLLHALQVAGREQCYYCDTDSLITTELGYNRLQDAGLVASGELGKWQLKEIITDGEILGIKHYRANERIVCSGLCNDGSLSYNGGWNFWQNDSPGWQVSSNHKPEATIRLRDFSRTAYYAHGIVNPDGTVTPFVLEE